MVFITLCPFQCHPSIHLMCSIALTGPFTQGTALEKHPIAGLSYTKQRQIAHIEYVGLICSQNKNCICIEK